MTIMRIIGPTASSISGTPRESPIPATKKKSTKMPDLLMLSNSKEVKFML